MADTNEGTTPSVGEAQTPPATGTPSQPDEVTTLRSRNAGLDAKVTELTKAQKAAEDRAAEAAAKLAAYEAGKVNADEALRAQLQAKEQELEAARREATLNRIEAKYPETFALFGAAVVGMADDVLAASEARLKGAGLGTPETPTPVGTNAGREQTGQKALEDMNAKEVDKYLRTQFTPAAMGLG
jgi:hypothetical protein